MPSKSPVVLNRSLETTFALTGAGSDAETTMKQIVIKGGDLGSNGFLRVKAWFTMTNNANNKTVKVKYGTATFISKVFASVAGGFVECLVKNTDTAVQSGVDQAGTVASGTIDSTIDQNLTITGQLATTTDTLTIVGYTIESAYQ